ncbi:helix-turn-helix domain-containing protein, partial [Massilia sp. UBA6681]|uniref:helix-turn-helix domain-containing protein n=1 Tax=Massilia sp. UBA6681 TaxID=1946839 RepID=UPI0025B8FF30
MNEHADQPATPGNDAGIPGKTLQSQREAMGWSVEQVADQLKLAPRQVVALEAGDYASLPSPAVTRGFVRAYAKLLKIDAAPLVAKIEMNMPPEAQAGATASIPRREQRPASFSQSRFPIGGKRNKVPVGLIAGVAVLVAAGAALWHFGLLPGSEQPQADNGALLETPVVTPHGGAPAALAHQDSLQNPSVPLISVPAPAGEGATAPAGA